MDTRRTRKRNRLTNYDYSANGAYFVTVCTKDRTCLFWEPTVGARSARPQYRDALSEMGLLVEQAISEIGKNTLGVDVVHYSKSAVTKQLGFSAWQKSFHDHIIRSQVEFHQIWEYIDNNPAAWEQDCFFASR